jgi:hypothetical protein
MRWRGSNATWPFAELVVDDDGLRLRLRARLLRTLLHRWLPTVQVRWPDVQDVRTIRGGFGRLPGNSGLEFVSSSLPPGRVVFWCTASGCDKLVAYLRERGIATTADGIVW